MIMAQYYRNLKRIPAEFDAFNIREDWVLFSTEEPAHTMSWDAAWGDKIHPMSPEVLSWFMQHAQCTYIESRVFADFIRGATDDDDRHLLLVKLIELAEHRKQKIQSSFKVLEFDMGDGDTVRLIPSYMSFNTKKAYEKYVSAIERGE